ncbi:MAG: fructose-bisphosphate aldolase class I [Candidatus Nomurabacteria bacterium]|jgi:fructose-bisphosphate aldolase class I|nr:fructose-bisphosphate aldolase class I [Candidatus Nomurabacteria bacterium]
MKKIFVVGNLTKDVYLKLNDERMLADEHSVKWLDISFDGSEHRYFRRLSVHSGLAVAIDVLNRLGLETGFVDAGHHHKDYRYILSNENRASIFVPSTVSPTLWQEPQDEIGAVFVDNSANMTEELAGNVAAFLGRHEDVTIGGWYLKGGMASAGGTINFVSEKADFVGDKVFLVGKNEIDGKLDGKTATVRFHLNDKEELLTVSTVRSIIASTIFGALLLGRPLAEALLLAKYNVENATLHTVNSLKKLEGMISGKEYEVIGASGEVKVETEPEQTVRRLMKKGKGILAADESGGSIERKFAARLIENNEKNRRDYRNIFLSLPNLGEYVSGAIMFDETARQHADNGQNFVDFVTSHGVIAGIKVDQGLVDIPNHAGEKMTDGLDGLLDRMVEYHNMGFSFAKWRAAFEIKDGLPSEFAIAKNCEILAEYAAVCQKVGIAPIVEPEVVYDGDYSIDQCAEVTGKILAKLFESLRERSVILGGTILKTNMILAGKKFAVQSTPEEVGAKTAEVLKAHVPVETGGVVFLSGGQSVTQSTENLASVIKHGPFPWSVTFSFARALQDPALIAWDGNNDNFETAQNAFRERLIANTAALRG